MIPVRPARSSLPHTTMPVSPPHLDLPGLQQVPLASTPMQNWLAEQQDKVEELSLDVEERIDSQGEHDDQDLIHDKGAVFACPVEETEKIWTLLGGIAAQKVRHQLIECLFENLQQPGMAQKLVQTDGAGIALLGKVWPGQPPLVSYLALTEAIAVARQQGVAPAVLQAMEKMALELAERCGVDLVESLSALGRTVASTGLALAVSEPTGQVQCSLDLLHGFQQQGISLVQLLDVLQQQLGPRLHQVLRIATSRNQHMLARLLQAMQSAQLMVLIRSALDAAMTLIVLCERYKSPLRLCQEELAGQLLTLLDEPPSPVVLKALPQQWLAQVNAGDALFFSELRYVLEQYFTPSSWRSLPARQALLDMLEQWGSSPLIRLLTDKSGLERV